jgi:hypothetical protein
MAGSWFGEPVVSRIANDGTMGKEAAKLLGRLSSPDQADRDAAGLENRKPSLTPTKLTQETVCVFPYS